MSGSDPPLVVGGGGAERIPSEIMVFVHHQHHVQMSGSVWWIDEPSRLVHPKRKTITNCASGNEVQEAKQTLSGG